MSLFSRISFLSVVALFCVTTLSLADELPVATWKLHVSGQQPSDLVITEVQSDGKVIGEVFGRPIKGKWDGTKLSLQTGGGTVQAPLWAFDGWLIKEKEGENVRYTLTGRFEIRAYCLDMGPRR